MRTMRRVGVALLTALALSSPVFAQSSDNRVSLNDAIQELAPLEDKLKK